MRIERKAVSGIMLPLLLISMLTLAFNIQPVKAEPTTIIVPDDYSTIQEAINAASVGDTIYVKAGTYYENVVVNKTVKLIGENRNATIIDGKGTGTVIYVIANDVTVSGFAIRNRWVWGQYGIFLEFVQNSHIYGNDVQDNFIGILVQNSRNSTITFNELKRNAAGSAGHNLVIRNSSQFLIIGNNLTDETIAVVDGIWLVNSNSGVVSKNYAYNMEKSFGIALTSSDGNTIADNNITNNGEGIELYDSHNNTLHENDVTTNNKDGIRLEYSSNNTISGNEVTNNDFGINLYSSSNNTLSGNNITNNRYGIRLRNYNSNNTFSGNNITNNGEGISLSYSLNNTFSGNNIRNNWSGIYLYYSPHSILCGNSITDNDFGIYLEGAPSYNSIYHNNFIDNIQQVYFSTSGYANFWDDGYPSGGNYWSDYTDVDLHSGPNQNETGNDGIWDHSYDMDLNNKDRYPLVNPWVPRIVGVRVGDWVKYTVEITGYRPGFPVDLNDVEWGKTSVQAISGTIIEVELVFHLKNGTEITMTGPVDVVTSGYPSPTFMSGLFIAKDLPTGATLYATYPLGPIPPSLKINETISKEYLGVSRETNHVNTTKWGIHVDAYWDKATGVLIESKETFSTSWSWHVQIVDTNLWKAPIPTDIDELKTEVEELGSEGQIDNQGIVRSLMAKLNVAQKLIDKGKIEEAETILIDDFIPQVQNLSAIHVTIEAANILIKSAEYIMSHL